MKVNGRQYKLIQERETAQLWQISFPGGAPFFEVRNRRVCISPPLPGAINWTYYSVNTALEKIDSLLPASVEKVAEIERGHLKTAA